MPNTEKWPLIALCNNGTASPSELEFLYEHDREITSKTFFKYVNRQQLSEYLGYAFGYQKGLHLVNDWHLRYYRSKFRGRPCMHLVWSDIDHVFQRDS